MASQRIIVGMSGGGKSTLARLIARFYDPREGTVRVDGNDLREIDLVHYRRQLGVVLQDPFLFAGTIADNLRFAAPGASDELVDETARAIGLDRVAARFSEGLDHAVREGGSGRGVVIAPCGIPGMGLVPVRFA